MARLAAVHRATNVKGVDGVVVSVLLFLFYLPTFYELATFYWQAEEQSYSPLVALAVLYLFWSLRPGIANLPVAPRPYCGSVLVALGLVAYVVGRSQGVMLFEAGSALPVIAGTLLLLRGMTWLRKFWLPISYLIFLVPLPGIFVDWVTGPLKMLASNIAEIILYRFDYPIARTGVTLTVGKYQLLVADACSGLRSIFSLFVLGLIYLHALRRTHVPHNLLLLLSIVPIVLLANTARVLMLVLVIYHLGEQVGMGIVHGLSGLVTFVLALTAFMGLDSWLKRRATIRSELSHAVA